MCAARSTRRAPNKRCIVSAADRKAVNCRHRSRGECCRLLRAAEAARDVARGLHRAWRHGGGAGPCSPGHRLRRAALHRGRRRRVGLPEHVVGRRYRRADGAHRQAVRSRRPDAPARGAGFRPDAVGRLGDGAGPRRQLLAAGLLAFTIFFYVVVYSMWLKRSTPQNIVIGGAAGALPPMIGWAVGDRRCRRWSRCCCSRSSSCGRRRISGRWRCSARATMPAPACRCCRRSPGPPRPAGRSCSIRLVLVAVAACAAGVRHCDWLYLVVTSLILGAGMLAFAINVYRHRTAAGPKAARRLFAFSILYCSCCSPCCCRWLRGHRAVGLVEAHGPMRQQRKPDGRRSFSPRSRRSAGASGRSRSPGRSGPGPVVFRGDVRQDRRPRRCHERRPLSKHPQRRHRSLGPAEATRALAAT